MLSYLWLFALVFFFLYELFSVCYYNFSKQQNILIVRIFVSLFSFLKTVFHIFHYFHLKKNKNFTFFLVHKIHRSSFLYAHISVTIQKATFQLTLPFICRLIKNLFQVVSFFSYNFFQTESILSISFKTRKLTKFNMHQEWKETNVNIKID